MKSKTKQMQAKVRNLKRQMEADSFLKNQFLELIASRRRISDQLPDNNLAIFDTEVIETLIDLFEVPKEEYETFYAKYKATMNAIHAETIAETNDN